MKIHNKISTNKQVNIFINFLNDYQTEKKQMANECKKKGYSIQEAALNREIRSLDFVKGKFFKIFHTKVRSYNYTKVLNAVAQFYLVNPETIIVKHAKGKSAKAKKIFVYMYIHYVDPSDKNLSIILGMERSSITFARNRIVKSLPDHPELLDEIEQILNLVV